MVEADVIIRLFVVEQLFEFLSGFAAAARMWQLVWLAGLRLRYCGFDILVVD